MELAAATGDRLADRAQESGVTYKKEKVLVSLKLDVDYKHGLRRVEGGLEVRILLTGGGSGWCGGGDGGGGLFGLVSASLLYRRECCVAIVCGDGFVFVVYGLRWEVVESVRLQVRWKAVLPWMFDCSADVSC